MAGLRDCWIQPRTRHAAPVWNPDIDQPINFFDGWQRGARRTRTYDNAFKVQWELFLRHVVDDDPFRWTLLEGAKGVQLAELGLRVGANGAWSTCRR